MKTLLHTHTLRLSLTACLLIFSVALSYGQLLSVSIGGIVQPCFDDGQATATVTGGTPPYTYSWYNHYSGTIMSTSSTATGLTAGFYHVYVEDAASNIGYDSIEILLPFNFGISPVGTACPAATGSVTATVLGGTAPYDYLWSNGVNNTGIASTSNTISGLAPGQYDVIIIDALGCGVSTASLNFGAIVNNTAPVTMNFTKTPSDCFNGTATVNATSGTAPYSYLWNTSPAQVTQTATGLAPGWQTVTVTDANGCTGNNMVNIVASATFPGASATVINNMCPSVTSGAIDLNVTGTAPFTYSWNTGAASQDITSLTNGYYSVDITDGNGCTITRGYNVVGTSPVSLSVTAGYLVSCMPGTGTGTAVATGGTPPYTYTWSDGSTGTTCTNMNYGAHSVTATDANGCFKSKGMFVNYDPSCYMSITGNIINDQNGNCTQDAIDTRLPSQIVSVTPGYYTVTTYAGAYNFQVLGGGTYAVNYNHPPLGWSVVCPTSAYNVTGVAGGTYPGHDFYVQPSVFFNNLESNILCGVARNGFSQESYVYIRNKGTTTLSGTLEVEHDAAVTYSHAVPAATAYNGATRTLSFNFLNLGPYETRQYKIVNNVSASTPLGTPVGLHSRIIPIVGETDTLDNYDSCGVVVVGSYDPNIKEVNPAGNGAPGYIRASNDYMEYTVHFQNTGTDTAFTVQIIDTLDTDLEITSFELIGSSFPVVWNISGPGIATFTFNEINLPDSTRDEPNSHGFVSYRLRQRPGLAEGTEITNTAYIYFDFNTPIITNTTLNTIDNTLAVIENNDAEKLLNVFPNPASETVYFSGNVPADVVINILDITGRITGTAQANGTGYTFNVSTLENGVYVYQAINKGQVLQSGKFVVNK